MKQIAIIFSAIAFSSFISVSGQTSVNHYNIGSSADALPVSTESKAFKNFRRAYPEVTGEKWSQQNDHYIASFKTNHISNKVVYTKSGQVDYSLKIYTPEQLPAAIQRSVKSVYYDYTITNAQELHTSMQTIFLVKITNGTTWKTIRLSNGDMDEIENYYSTISPCR
jgi:hypothetical protein